MRREHRSETTLEQVGVERPPGFHTTPTVDVRTPSRGELYCLLDGGPNFQRPGDTLIERGTEHSWSDRTDEIVLPVPTMVDVRDAEGRSYKRSLPGP